jgi:hypothetical protein
VNAAYVSATVAGAAVFVSGVMQYLTLRRAKEDVERTVAATERTARMTALCKDSPRPGKAKLPTPKRRNRELWPLVPLLLLWWAKLGCAQTMR